MLVDGAPRGRVRDPGSPGGGPIDHDPRRTASERAQRWAEPSARHGASQCGFCTPGIIVRLEGLRRRRHRAATTSAASSVPCWRTCAGAPAGGRSSTRGALPWHRSPDRAPRDDLDAARRPGRARGRAAAAASARRGARRRRVRRRHRALRRARRRAGRHAAAGPWARRWPSAPAPAGKVQGRRTTVAAWSPDRRAGRRLGARRCARRGSSRRTSRRMPRGAGPAASRRHRSPTAARSAASVDSGAVAAARALADQHGRAVRVLLSPRGHGAPGPEATPDRGRVRADGTRRRAGRPHTRHRRRHRLVAPRPECRGGRRRRPADFVQLCVRRAGRRRPCFSLAAHGSATAVVAPNGARASRHRSTADGMHVSVDCRRSAGRSRAAVLSASVLRTWRSAGSTSEGIAVDDEGEPVDLTIRSFGVLRAVDTPPIRVDIESDDGARTAPMPCSPRWPPPPGSRRLSPSFPDRSEDSMTEDHSRTCRHGKRQRRADRHAEAGAKRRPEHAKTRRALHADRPSGGLARRVRPGRHRRRQARRRVEWKAELRQAIANLRALLESEGRLADRVS